MAELRTKTAAFILLIFTIPLWGQSIIYSGNTSFPDERIEEVISRELEALEESPVSVGDIVDAAYTLETWYRSMGFPDVTVSFRMEHTQDGAPDVSITDTGDFDLVERITFNIVEGRRFYLGDVRFTGNRAFEDQILEAYVDRSSSQVFGGGRTHFQRAEIVSAANRVRQHYLLEGYLEIQVAEPVLERDKDMVHAVIALKEGPQFTIEQIYVTDLDPLPVEISREILKRIPQKGDTYTERLAADGADRIERYLGMNGYITNVRYSIESNTSDASVAINYEFTPGKQFVLENILIIAEDAADLRTRRWVIEGLFPAIPGEVVNEEAVDTGRQRLYETGLFTMVSTRFIPVEEDSRLSLDNDQQAVTLEILVHEDPGRFVDFSAGWNNAAGPTGSVEYVDRNIFGSGRSWRIGGEGSSLGYVFSSRIADPLILGLGSTISLEAVHRYRIREAFSEYRTSAKAEADISLSRYIFGALHYEYAYSRIYEADEVAESPNEIFLHTINARTLWSTLDSVIYPSRGGQNEISFGFSGVFPGRNIYFLRADMEHTQHFPFFDRLIFSLQGGGGVLIPLMESSIPVSERLYLGGSSSVRSFSQDSLSPRNDQGVPIGGLAQLSGTGELRIEILNNFYIALFYDIGVVSEQISELPAPGHAIGGGFRYRLPIGPLRIDAAINPGPTYGSEDNWAIHFSIGSGF